MKWQHANGRECKLNEKTTFERWVDKFGEEGALQKKEEFRVIMSNATRGEKNSMYGKKQPKLAERNASLKGKTLEEIHGIERAQDIKARISINLTGEKNPAYGKVYKRGGKSLKGYYKGQFFRSLLELSFLKHLEEKQFISLDKIKSECYKIPYFIDGAKHIYTPDFYVPDLNCVYEVKPLYATTILINVLKASAAKEYFTKQKINYHVVTENNFQKLKFLDVKDDLDIEWDTRTFKYFKEGRK